MWLGDELISAIASQFAATLYGLNVLMQNLEDNPENYTRFFVLGREETKGEKCALKVTLKHETGSLAKLLSIIAKKGVNVTSIVSRPLVGRLFEYAFYLELEMPTRSLLQAIEAHVPTFRDLGSFSFL